VPENQLETAQLESTLVAWLASRSRRVLPETPKHAAVLVPLFCEADGWHVVLTKRSESLRSHQGQISFPGGQKEAHDTTLADTALRESREEIGLATADVRLLGAFDDIETVLGVRVTPYLGVIPAQYRFVPAPAEVAAVFSLPMPFFANPANRRIEHRTNPDGRERTIYFFDRPPEEPVWGATARILVQLVDALQADLNAENALTVLLSGA